MPTPPNVNVVWGKVSFSRENIPHLTSKHVRITPCLTPSGKIEMLAIALCKRFRLILLLGRAATSWPLVLLAVVTMYSLPTGPVVTVGVPTGGRMITIRMITN